MFLWELPTLIRRGEAVAGERRPEQNRDKKQWITLILVLKGTPMPHQGKFCVFHMLKKQQACTDNPDPDVTPSLVGFRFVLSRGEVA